MSEKIVFDPVKLANYKTISTTLPTFDPTKFELFKKSEISDTFDPAKLETFRQLETKPEIPIITRPLMPPTIETLQPAEERETLATLEKVREPISEKIPTFEAGRLPTTKEVWKAIHTPMEVSKEGWGKFYDFVGLKKDFPSLREDDPKFKAAFRSVALRTGLETVTDFASFHLSPEYWAFRGALKLLLPTAAGVSQLGKIAGETVGKVVPKTLYKAEQSILENHLDKIGISIEKAIKLGDPTKATDIFAKEFGNLMKSAPFSRVIGTPPAAFLEATKSLVGGAKTVISQSNLEEILGKISLVEPVNEVAEVFRNTFSTAVKGVAQLLTKAGLVTGAGLVGAKVGEELVKPVISPILTITPTFDETKLEAVKKGIPLPEVKPVEVPPTPTKELKEIRIVESKEVPVYETKEIPATIPTATPQITPEPQLPVKQGIMPEVSETAIKSIVELAKEIKNNVSVGTGNQIDRLIKGYKNNLIDESTTRKALDLMYKKGGAGKIAIAEESIEEARKEFKIEPTPPAEVKEEVKGELPKVEKEPWQMKEPQKWTMYDFPKDSKTSYFTELNKQPIWQITQQQYTDVYALYEKPEKMNNTTALVIAKGNHSLAVKQALSEGKPVPPEVLKDYPDLQKEVLPKGKEEITPAVEKFAIKPIPGKYITLDPVVVKVAPEELQLRETPFAQETVNAIQESGWDEAQYGAIPVVKRADGYYVAGDGHSRLEAYKQLKEAGKEVPESLDFRVVTESEAKRLRLANLKRTQLKPLEEMKAFTELVSKGKSISNIATEFGISPTYVENSLSLKNLSEEMKQLIRDKGFPIQHAFVLGKAVSDYNIPAEVQSELFHKFIKTQDPTPLQLKMFLDKIGSKVSEQISLGLTGLEISKGMGGVLKDVFAKVKEIEQTTGKKEYQTIIKAVDRLKKRNQTIPPGIASDYAKIKVEVDKADTEIKQLLKGIKFEKPIEPAITLGEKKAFYQQDIDGNWEKVIPMKKKPVSLQKIIDDKLTLWSHLSKPKFDLPPSQAVTKPEPVVPPAKQEEVSFQVDQPKRPKMLIDSQIDLVLKEKKDMVLATSLSVTKPEDVVDMFYELKNADREHFYIVMLDRNDKILGTHLVSLGTLTSAIISPRETLKAPLLLKAKKIIPIHNHPSRNVSVSEEDVKVTKGLMEAAKMVDIDIPYHIIIDDKEFGILYPEGNGLKKPYQEPEKRPYEVKNYDVLAEIQSGGFVSEKVITTPSNIVDVIKPFLDKKKGSLIAVYLDGKNSVLAVELIGNEKIVNKPDMLAKKIFNSALRNNSAALVLAHNFDKPFPVEIVEKIRKADITFYDVIGIDKDFDKNENYTSLAESKPEFFKEKAGEYLSPDKVRSDIEKLRARIGISTERYAGIKQSIIGKVDTTEMDLKELLRLKKVLEAVRKEIKLPPEKEPAETKPEPEQVEKVIEKLERPEIIVSPEEHKILNALKAVVHSLERKYKLTQDEAQQVKIDTIGWASVKGANREELLKVISRMREFGQKRSLEKWLHREAERVKLIVNDKENNFRRFIKNYYQKKPDELTIDELRSAIENIGKLQVNYKGIVTIPRTLQALLFPQHKTLLAQHKIGLGKYIFEPYEYLKLFDLDENIANLRELGKLVKERMKTPQEIVNLIHQILPLEGNDLRYLDKFGLHKEVGAPLEKAGFEYRKLSNEYAKIVEKWVKAAKETPEGNELMFKAADSPFTPEIKEMLTPNQISAVEEWFKWRDYFADKFGIKKPLSNYIHHLIEETMQIYIRDKYPFPEELAAIMEHIIPNQIFTGFLKERLGFPFIKRDFIAATSAYFRVAARKIAYDPALKEINAKLRILKLSSPQLANYLKEFIQINILGRQTEQAKLIANTANNILESLFKEKIISLPPEMVEQIKQTNSKLPIEFQVPRFHITPSSINRFISNVKLLNYLSLIALNARTTFVNLTQVTLGIAKMQVPIYQRFPLLLKTWAWSGVKVFQPSFWKKMNEQGILEEMQRWMETDNRANKIMQEFVGYSMVNMKLTEFINRVTSSKLGIEQKRILAEKGMISTYELDKLIEQDPDFLEEAKLLDKEFSDAVNYLYGADYTPPIFMSPMGRIAYHLNSFSLKYGNRIITFAKEVQLGQEIKKFNSIMGKAGWTEDDVIKFVQGLPPQKRSNFMFLLIMMTTLGITLGSWTYFTLKAIGIGVNPILQSFLYLLAGEPQLAWKEFTKSFIPFRGMYKRIIRIIKEGVPGIWRIGKIEEEKFARPVRTFRSIR